MNYRSSQSGFSAVELLITLFVAAAFIIAGYQLFNVIIKDGGETRAESRASNVAYDYLRRYSSSATNPCTPQTPMTAQSVTVADLTDVTVSVTITCTQPDAPTLSKIEAVVTYGDDATAVRYATYIDKSTGASPVVDITEGLLARYPFNGNGNADAGGPNGVVRGAMPTTNRSGVANTAYGFNAPTPTQNIEIPSTFGVSNTDVSITLWVYQAGASASGQYIKIGDPAGFGIGIGNGNFDNTSSGPEIIGLFEGLRWIDTNTALGTGWHHLAMVLSSAGVPSIYRDGVLVGTYTGVNSYVPNGNMTRIGGTTNRLVTGSMDDVRIYGRSLSASEVLQLYNGGPK